MPKPFINFNVSLIVLIDDLVDATDSLEETAEDDLEVAGHVDEQDITNVDVQGRHHHLEFGLFQVRNVFENQTEQRGPTVLLIFRSDCQEIEKNFLQNGEEFCFCFLKSVRIRTFVGVKFEQYFGSAL